MKGKKTLLISCFIVILLSSNSISNVSFAYVESNIEFGGNIIAFDQYHGGYHSTDIDDIVSNLTFAGNQVLLINDVWDLPDETDSLILTCADVGEPWLTSQIDDIVNWLDLGNKLLWVSGDSDYGGFFNPNPINNVLNASGALVRLDGTSISDTVSNDGAEYRIAAKDFGVGDPFYDTEIVNNLTKDMSAGAIFHGPCSILAYDGYQYRSLRYGDSIFPDRIWTILRFSENATSADTDISDNELDLYANIAETGNYPALVYEYLTEKNSHVIISGEAIYSDYQRMYSQKTASGVYNGGHHFGQVLVNNIFNNFLEDKEFPTPTPTPTPSTTETPTPSPTTIDMYFSVTVFTLSIITLVIIRSKKKS